MIEKGKNPKHSEESLSHQLVSRYMRGEIPIDKYAKSFSAMHRVPNLLEMSFNERELNKIYDEYPSLRPKDSNKPEVFKSQRGSLKAIVDNLEDKKNQIVEKVVDFAKRLGIFE